VILAGFVNNNGDDSGASFAVIDYEHPGGSSPALREKYRCQDCPAGRPIAFYIFPRSELSRALRWLPATSEIFVSEGGAITVAARQTALLTEPFPMQAIVLYRLDPQLNVVYAEHDGGYEQVHAQLEGAGMIKHKYSAAEERELWPVLRWDGERFVAVHAPQPHAAAASGTANARNR
jgi:hypothetical protein